jgi:hypothetical protein
MAEVLLEFQTPVIGPDGSYLARAVGAEVPGGNWQGWIEFTPISGGEPLCSPRETTQPNRADIVYWATGVTNVYLEGALSRARTPLPAPAQPPMPPPAFDAPARRRFAAPRKEAGASVLDPFSVFEKGEAQLRRQLGALSWWRLVDIIVDYGLSNDSRASLGRMPPFALVETIVTGVRNTVQRSAGGFRGGAQS